MEYSCLHKVTCLAFVATVLGSHNVAGWGYVSSSGRDPTALGSASLAISWYVRGFCQYFQENPEEIPSNKLALFIPFVIAYLRCSHPIRRYPVDAYTIETD
jgi:hypothetical protein